jgi:hypothetical protein
MSNALQEAIDRLRQIPEDRQDSLARLILHEMEEDDRWCKSTADNADRLGGFVDEILAADRRGECMPLDPERL